MKVVIFIDWFTPAYKAGGPIQSVLNLVNQPIPGIEYFVVCSNKDLDGKTLENVRYDEWVEFNSKTKVWYNSNNKATPKLLKDLAIQKPDIYFINGLYSFYYNLLPLTLGKATKKIISARGMLHAGALSEKSLKKKLYLNLWKLFNIHRKHSFHATNTDEEKFIKKIFGKNAKVFIAQNLPRKLESIPISCKKISFLKLISIGLVSPMKNYLEVIKSLSNCKASIDYTIYGPVKEPAYWQECLTEIEKLPPNIRVHYNGDLPSANVQEALNKAEVFILPSKSENFGHAIYEALTAGKPVITSHNTPWNNLKKAKAGFNISVEKDYELSEAICSFATFNNQELAEWSAGAKGYAEKAIDIEQIKNQYKTMFSVED